MSESETSNWLQKQRKENLKKQYEQFLEQHERRSEKLKEAMAELDNLDVKKENNPLDNQSRAVLDVIHQDKKNQSAGKRKKKKSRRKNKKSKQRHRNKKNKRKNTRRKKN